MTNRRKADDAYRTCSLRCAVLRWLCVATTSLRYGRLVGHWW